MRIRMLALAIAVSAVSSGPLQAQNSAQNSAQPLEATNTLPLELGTQSGLYPAIEITPPAHRAAATTATSNVNIDWRSKGAVTPVQDQGQCGSDWAFSAKGAAESAIFFRTGKLNVLSAQQLVSCGGSQGSQGCSGGLPIQGLDFLKKFGGVTEASYPYTARDGACRQATVVGKISGTRRPPVGDDAALLTMLETDGPVSVAVDRDLERLYHGGVHSCAARTSEVLYALLVGAGNDPSTGEPFWLLKFSYGTTFGEKGYVRISRLRPNECGISEDAVVALP